MTSMCTDDKMCDETGGHSKTERYDADPAVKVKLKEVQDLLGTKRGMFITERTVGGTTEMSVITSFLDDAVEIIPAVQAARMVSRARNMLFEALSAPFKRMGLDGAITKLLEELAQRDDDDGHGKPTKSDEQIKAEAVSAIAKPNIAKMVEDVLRKNLNLDTESEVHVEVTAVGHDDLPPHLLEKILKQATKDQKPA